jgi:serine/threonine-protein kinase RsbW
MGETVELTLPLKAELMSLIRFAAATLAAQAEFSVEEIEDLRLATDEMCLSVTGGTGESPVHLRFDADSDLIEISCTVDMDSIKPQEAASSEAEWSLRILDALVDEHGRETVDGKCTAWLRKRRALSAV